MNNDSTVQFATIESALEYLGLLTRALLESREAVEADIRAQPPSASPQRLDALKLIDYNLEKLTVHLERSHRILNDLRSLRRLLHEERKQIAA